ADHVVDMGPGAGEHGGHVIASGTPDAICACEASLTGAYLSHRRSIPLPTERHAPDPERQLLIAAARGNNLQEIDVALPVGLLTCV
ncbi:MAG: hypothetical protein KDG52_17905, partial [Rhodocyclaceae bacterium]|nr:hypothetical protein [Rhodocyclaceae bacterium]